MRDRYRTPTPYYCADCDVYYQSGPKLLEHVALEHDPYLGCGKPVRTVCPETSKLRGPARLT
jgi:hypothetical protein